MTTDNTELSAEQQTAIVKAKAVLFSKQDVLMAVGQVQAFDFVQKLLTVSELKLIQQIKKSKSYKGLTYKDESEKVLTVSTFDDFCKHILNSSRQHVDDKLVNLSAFGEAFFEASQRMSLGYRELRKLRQLPSEEQALIINSEAVDFGDKEAVKELIEDLNFKQVTEKSALEKELKEANETVSAVRENSAAKSLELDQVKEIEAKRTFKQAPWQRQAIDSTTAMMHAKTAFEQGVNQLSDVFDNLQNDESLDDKAIDLIARSLLSEAQAAHALINNFTNEIFGVLGGKYRPDVSAEDTFISLQYEDAPAELSLAK